MDELEIATALRNMIQSQNQQLQVQARLLRGQLAVMEAQAEVMGRMSDTRVTDAFSEATREIEAAEVAMKSLGSESSRTMGAVTAGAAGSTTSVNRLGGALVTAGDNLQRLGVGGAILEGMQKGLDTAIEGFISAGNIIATVGSGLLDLGKSIFAGILLPFETLFSLVAAHGPSSNELRKTYEEVRKTFGSLSTNEGAAVIAMFKGLGRELGDTGLRTRRILGLPADQLRSMLDLSKSLGSQFNMVFNEGLIENAGNVIAFKKALDISDESMKTAARVAATTGRTIDEVLQEQANYAIQLGESFGISSMVISRGMQEMENDMKHFGGMSKKTLAETTVYATKLGIEVKTLAGIMDTFDNFDNAADAAARLNQQFGIQLDTLEMLREEDPARRADMLRDSLNAAGVSYANLDRRSKSYLANQLNISEAEAELLFNEKNRGLSLDQIKKKSAEAEKKQLTQVEVMHKLADAIERLVQQGSQMEGGIFANFFKGFTEGIINSREMRTIFREIAQIFQMAIRYGRELGRVFVDMFPGIQDILGGFGDLFNPSRWRNMFRGIVDAFKSFFQTIETNPEAGLRTLFKRLQDIFFNNFDASKSGGSRLIEGFKKFFGTILRTLVAAVRVIVPELLKALRDGIRYLNDLINGRAGGMGIDFQGLWNDISGTFVDLVDEIGTFLTTFWDRYGEDIWNALVELGTSIMSRIGPWLQEHWGTIVLGLGAWFGTGPLMGALSAGLGSLFTGAIAEAIPGGLGGAAAGGAAAGAAAGAGSSGLAEVAAAAGEATSSASTLETFAATAGSIGVGVLALGQVFEYLFEFAKNMQDQGITASSVAMASGAMLAGVAMVGGLIYALSDIDVSGLGSVVAMLGSAAFAGFITVLTGEVLTNLSKAIEDFAAADGPMNAILDAVGRVMEMATNVTGFGQALNAIVSIMSAVGSLISGMGSIVMGQAAQDAVVLADAVADEGFLGMLFGGTNEPAVTGEAPDNNPITQLTRMISAISTVFATEIPRLINAASVVGNLSADDLKNRLDTITTIVNVFKDAIIPMMDAMKGLADTTQNTSETSGGIFSSSSSSTASTTTFNLPGIQLLLEATLSGIADLISGVMESAQNIDPANITALGSIRPLLEGAATIIATIGTSLKDAFKTETTNNITDGVEEAQTVTSSIDLNGLENIFTTLGEFITTVLEASDVFFGRPPEEIRVIGEAIGDMAEAILEATNGIMQTILSPGLIEAAGAENAAERIARIKNFVTDMATLIFDPDTGMMTHIKTMITDIIGLNIKADQAAVLQASAALITSLLGGLAELMKAIGGVLTPLSEQATEGDAPDASSMTSLTDFMTNIGGVFEQLQGILPDLVSNINAAFEGVSVSTLGRRTDALNNVIGMLTSFIDFAIALRRFDTGSEQLPTMSTAGGLFQLNQLFTGTPNIFTLIRTAIEGLRTIDVTNIPNLTKTKGAIENLASITSSLESLNNSRKTIEADMGALNNFIGEGSMTSGTLTGLLSGIGTALGSLVGGSEGTELLSNLSRFNSQFAPKIVQATEYLGNIASNLLPIGQNVTEELKDRVLSLVDTISETVDAVSGLNAINLSTTLEALSNNLGLSGVGAYTITNENFNLTINMHVTIDAGTFEEVFYKRAIETDATDRRFTNTSFTTPTNMSITPDGRTP